MTGSNCQGKLDTSVEHQPPVLQPANFRVTPSKPVNPWCSQWLAGDHYSRHQRAVMQRDRIDPETVGFIRVKRSAVQTETWFPKGYPAPVHEYDCPILQRRLDGKLRILSPAGVPVIVLDDGWVAVPRQVRGWKGNLR